MRRERGRGRERKMNREGERERANGKVVHQRKLGVPLSLL